MTNTVTLGLSRQRIERAASIYATTKDAAAAIGIHPASFRRLCRKYDIPTPQQRKRSRQEHGAEGTTAMTPIRQPITTLAGFTKGDGEEWTPPMVICTDGAVFAPAAGANAFCDSGPTWVEMCPIPGSRRAVEMEERETRREEEGEGGATTVPFPDEAQTIKVQQIERAAKDADLLRRDKDYDPARGFPLAQKVEEWPEGFAAAIEVAKLKPALRIRAPGEGFIESRVDRECYQVLLVDTGEILASFYDAMQPFKWIDEEHPEGIFLESGNGKNRCIRFRKMTLLLPPEEA